MTSSSSKIFIGNLPNEIRENEIREMFEKFGKIRFVNLKLPPRPPPYAFLEFEDARDADDACREMHHKEIQGNVIRVEITRERRANDDRQQDRGRDRYDDRRQDRGRDRHEDRGRDRYDNDRGRDRYDNNDRRPHNHHNDRYDNDRRQDRGRDRHEDRGPGPQDRYEDRRSTGGRQNPGETPYRVRVSGLERDVSWQDLKDLMRKGGDVMHTEVDRRGGGLCHFSSREEMTTAIRKLDDSEYRGQRISLEEDNGTSRSRSRSGGHGHSRRSGSRRRSTSNSRRRSTSGSRSPDPHSNANHASAEGRRRSSISRSRSPEQDKVVEEDHHPNSSSASAVEEGSSTMLDH